MEKKCNDCNIIKDLNEFCKSKRGLYGRNSICKSCVSIKNKHYHKIRYDGDALFREKKLKLANEWVARNPEKRAIIAKKRNIKEKNNSPQKVKCRALVNQRVRFGRIPKASSLNCSECGDVAAHYHHYLGYEFKNRYDVLPVCINCHIRLG